MSGNVRNICLTALGIALFVVLTLCLQVPVFENYYLCLGYIVMAVWLNSVGIASGTVAGTAGVILYCLLTGGLRGMPGWAAGNVLIGLLLGAAFRLTRPLAKPSGSSGAPASRLVLRTVILIAVIIASCAAGILIVKSVTESLLYSQPMIIRIAKNTSAFIADAAVLILALPVCAVTENRLKKWKKTAGPEAE